ncbi:M15 family metallopeptidase [Tessaracoccus flavus]|uniref:Peptidase M15C domain-containing protein n=1 Tax=Tessaracoccus flavus TaxID=1610493 RepID=A0A1Q2CHA6_9ACTN|nr:M15 family metallopeptidase [Tessaracoccus flavus]AQP45491.1 hypothetical protein RPIT_12335 [Tessaracoccus flavus]SDY90855.1 D-alanyl-D-alanine carboxypeptidase [Tessaracoccus flavus]
MAGPWRALLATAAVVASFVAAPPTADADEPFDVYTTPGTHEYNGRLWRTACEPYSSSVERCRTEIDASVVVYADGRFVEQRGWAFNNLTYKPSARDQWVDNILARPGEHVVDGRRWKTECDTPWTGDGACRSSIWTDTFHRRGSSYVKVPTWVFNNIVRFTPAQPTSAFCAAPASAAVQSVITASAPAPDNSPPTDAPAADDLASPPAPADVDAVTPATPSAPATADAAVAAPEPEAARPSNDVADEPSSPPADTVEAEEPASDVVPLSTPPPTISAVRHRDFSGGLYDRFGDIEVTGTSTSGAGWWLRVELRDSAGAVLHREDLTTGTGGAYRALVPGGFTGKATVVVISANGQASQAIEVQPATVTQTSATSLDPVAPATITGALTPAVDGVLISAQIRTAGGWLPVSYARTAADGSYALPYSHGSGQLGSADVRVCATTAWGATVPGPAATTLARARLANPEITATTADEVAATYRAGCPVGPSGLRTVRINQQSMDGRIYRGEIIVRTQRAAEVADVFRRTFDAGFPVYQMTNPNAFGADDPRMMAANNTSAFNCRRVVGNPYAMSPHSYGYAVDVNPWQNPYRDPTGKWWPSTDHVSRTPVVPGQLTESSAPVVAMKDHGWRWFSGWDWHHFEKR